LGPVLAVLAAWLLPQRTDLGSAAALVAVFSAGAGLATPAIHRARPFVLGIATALPIALALIHAHDALLVIGVLGVVAAAAISVAGSPRTERRPRRARTLAFGTTLVLVTFLMTGYFGASTVSAQWFGSGVTHGPRDSGRVAITFDDDPNTSVTPELMRILDAAHVQATFFIVGQGLV